MLAIKIALDSILHAFSVVKHLKRKLRIAHFNKYTVCRKVEVIPTYKVIER